MNVSHEVCAGPAMMSETALACSKLERIELRTRKMHRCAARGAQGDFVVLASEPVCICGVDVAAPQQVLQLLPWSFS